MKQKTMKCLWVIARVIWYFKWPLLAIAGMTWGIARICAGPTIRAVLLPTAFALMAVFIMLVVALLVEVARLG